MKVEFDTRAPFILLDVFLENQGVQKKVCMVLDTGSTYVLIPWEIGVIGLRFLKHFDLRINFKGGFLELN